MPPRLPFYEPKWPPLAAYAEDLAQSIQQIVLPRSRVGGTTVRKRKRETVTETKKREGGTNSERE